MILGLLALCCGASLAWAQIERNPESRTRPARSRLAERAAEHVEMQLPAAPAQAAFFAQSNTVARALILTCTEAAHAVALRFGSQTDEPRQAQTAAAQAAPAAEAGAESDEGERILEQAPAEPALNVAPPADSPATAAAPSAQAEAPQQADAQLEQPAELPSTGPAPTPAKESEPDPPAEPAAEPESDQGGPEGDATRTHSPQSETAPGQPPTQAAIDEADAEPPAQPTGEAAAATEQGELTPASAQSPVDNAEADEVEPVTVGTEPTDSAGAPPSLDDLATAQQQRRDVLETGAESTVEQPPVQVVSVPVDDEPTGGAPDSSTSASGREASLAGLLGWARALAAATAGSEPDEGRRPDLSEHIGSRSQDDTRDDQPAAADVPVGAEIDADAGAPADTLSAVSTEEGRPEREVLATELPGAGEPGERPLRVTDARAELDRLLAGREPAQQIGALLETGPLARSVVVAPVMETAPGGTAGGQAGALPPLEPQLDNWPPRMPEHQVPARVKRVSRGHPKRKQVALTFDDGPHPQFTSQLLAVLEFYDVPATFFFVGLQSQKYPHWVKMTHQAGHEIGSQTYDHFRLPKLPPEEQVYQIDEYQRLIEGLIGVTPRFLRPPGGQVDHGTEQLVAERGMVLALWDVGLNDTTDGKTAAQMLETARDKIRPGSVVLAHDGIQATVDMLPELITMLREQGYELVTMSELAAGL